MELVGFTHFSVLADDPIPVVFLSAHGFSHRNFLEFSIRSIDFLDIWCIMANVCGLCWYLAVRSWKSSLLYEYFILVIVCYLTRMRSAILHLPYGIDVCYTPTWGLQALVLPPEVLFSSDD